MEKILPLHLITREHVDYTEWQRTLWDDLSIGEVFKPAAVREKENS